MNWWTRLALVSIFVTGISARADRAGSPDARSIDLAGSWRLAVDTRETAAPPERKQFTATIRLPGQLAAQGFGEKPSIATRWTGDGWRYPRLFQEWQADANFKMPFFLQPPRRHVGPAWFQKEIEVPLARAGRQTSLFLERVHWRSEVWVDGRKIGTCDSLGTPHQYDLGALAPGKHTLTMRIDNRLAEINVGPLSHSVTDHTQGNWNGVVGTMELRTAPALRIVEARVTPSLAQKRVRVTVLASGKKQARVTALVKYAGPLRKTVQTTPIEADLLDGKAELTIPMSGELHPWNEFTPHLYVAEVTLTSASGTDTCHESFGFRDPGKKNGRLALNGIPLFLRGTLECCIFPLTGHPPTDVESWRRIIRICKAHGLNHMRFHSWCPPKAAFVAADELGFYYQVECSSWANQGAVIGSGGTLDAWLETESQRMLATYGNHPSFLMLAYGNEPAGRNHARWLQDWVARRQRDDSRRFYTTAAGWPVMPGSDFHSSPAPRIQAWGGGLKSILNGRPPSTDFNWSAFVQAHADAPVVSHEIGQWCVYPNFEEMAKYTGFFRAKNFEIFQETARRNGLLPQTGDFLQTSGKLQTLCYKHDIEAALRTPSFGGFQLLDLHDFPGQGTALVGVLDPFWDGKGYVTPEEYASFSGPIVPLAKLKKMIWTSGETLEAELLLSHFGPTPLVALEPRWTLSDGETVVASGKLAARDLAPGALYPLGRIAASLVKVRAPARLTLRVGATGQSFANAWDLFVYPAPPAETPSASDILITRDMRAALKALETGNKVLLLLPSAEVADDPERPLKAGFSSIFWNTAWTGWQSPHTLGILCDPKHPAFGAFPTQYHSNWQWWEVQKDAQPFILTQHRDLRPIVQVVDDWVTNRKLGYVFEARVGRGRLLASSMDLATGLDRRPVARQLRSSLLRYMQGPRFAPTAALTREQVEALSRPEPLLRKLGAKVSASSEESGYEAANVIDGDPSTIWHTAYTGTAPRFPHQLTIAFPGVHTWTGMTCLPRQDMQNGRIQGYTVQVSEDGKTWREAARGRFSRDGTRKTVHFDRPVRSKYLRLVAESSFDSKQPYASLAELTLLPETAKVKE